MNSTTHGSQIKLYISDVNYKSESNLYVTAVFENNTVTQLQSPIYPSMAFNLQGMKLRVVCVEVSKIFTNCRSKCISWSFRSFIF